MATSTTPVTPEVYRPRTELETEAVAADRPRTVLARLDAFWGRRLF